MAVDHNSETRTLSVSSELDTFNFVNIRHHQPLIKPTKHSFLSRIALIFYPLGLLGPSVVIAKLLMQELKRSKIDSDESISSESHTLWTEYEYISYQHSEILKYHVKSHAMTCET